MVSAKRLTALLAALMAVAPLAASPYTVTDAAGRRVAFSRVPERIVLGGRSVFMVADALYAFPEAWSRLIATTEIDQGMGNFLSAIDPEYIGILSLMLESGTEMTDAVRSGRFIVPKPLDLLRELREIIANIDVSHAVFRSNHASNYLPLRGTLPQDKAALLESLDRVIDMGGKARLKPEDWRAL